eukprot:gene11145-23297_t
MNFIQSNDEAYARRIIGNPLLILSFPHDANIYFEFKRAETYINPVKDREINLRGLKLSAIENISVLQDQFDVIDFSDNEIKKLDNLPKMKRLSTILLNNNYVSKISQLGENAPNISTLVLTNNRISQLSEIDNIAAFTKLELLSLLDNPITLNEHYRLYAIFKIPSLKSLDFRKVKKEERVEASKLFTSVTGKGILSSVEHDAQLQLAASRKGTPATLSEDQKKQIRDAIANASSPEEMDRIEKQLRAGTFPFTTNSESSSEQTDASASASTGATTGATDTPILNTVVTRNGTTETVTENENPTANGHVTTGQDMDVE